MIPSDFTLQVNDHVETADGSIDLLDCRVKAEAVAWVLFRDDPMVRTIDDGKLRAVATTVHRNGVQLWPVSERLPRELVREVESREGTLFDVEQSVVAAPGRAVRVDGVLYCFSGYRQMWRGKNHTTNWQMLDGKRARYAVWRRELTDDEAEGDDE